MSGRLSLPCSQAIVDHLDAIELLVDAYGQFYGRAPDAAVARRLLLATVNHGHSWRSISPPEPHRKSLQRPQLTHEFHPTCRSNRLIRQPPQMQHQLPDLIVRKAGVRRHRGSGGAESNDPEQLTIGHAVDRLGAREIAW